MARRINAVWHKANRMSPYPKPDERLAWHLAHNEACGCRAMPEGLREQVADWESRQPVKKA